MSGRGRRRLRDQRRRILRRDQRARRLAAREVEERFIGLSIDLG